MLNAKPRSLYRIAAAAMLLVACVWLRNLWVAQRDPLGFDDAYMFVRYATNLLHGHGFSWNPDGAPTYGPTSLLWTLLVTVFSGLPIKAWTLLTSVSWLCSVAAVVATAWAVARNARSAWFASPWRVLPLVAVPLLGAVAFSANQATGMETMLAMLLVAMFAGVTLRWADGRAGSISVGVLGVLLFLARPEAGLVVVALPTLSFLLRPEDTRVTPSALTVALGVFAVGVVVELAICRAYFGTALPLSFYMKGHNAYKGYAEIWYPELQLLIFLTCCQFFLVGILLLARRSDVRLLLCFLTPILLLCGYLQTVTQIMGFHARYYVPYLPLVVIPTLLIVDRRIDNSNWPQRIRPWRAVAVVALLGMLFVTRSERVLAHIRGAEGGVHTEYAPVTFTTAARVPLPPQDWAQAMTTITDDLIAKLPPGATVASTEVGYLGERTPQLNVIDMAGLNDTAIARNGFDTQAFLDRKPDLIWLPNSSYTWQRGVLFSDPRMLQEYDVYPDAAKFGIAIRKDSPFHGAIQTQFKAYWAQVYPDKNPDDYRATAAYWSGNATMVPNR